MDFSNSWYNNNLWYNNNTNQNQNLWSNNTNQSLWSLNKPQKKSVKFNQPVVNSKYVTIKNKNYIVNIKNSDSNNLFHSILSQINTFNLEQETISLREKVANHIHQNCINDINFKYKIYYYISTQWKEKWSDTFPEINNVKGDDLIMSYLKILKTNPKTKYNKLAFGGSMEINFISILLNIKIGVINNNDITFFNNNSIKTIYIFQDNDDFFIAKLQSY